MGLVVSFALVIRDKFHEWFFDPHINVMGPDGSTCMSMSMGTYLTDYHLALTDAYGEVTRHRVVTHQTNPVDMGERGIAFDLSPNHPLVIILGTMSQEIGHNYFIEVRQGKVRIGEGYIKMAVDKVIEYFKSYGLPIKGTKEEEEEQEEKKKDK